ncbi:MAG TPA: hypothetical protein VF572_01170 [Candidatus Saccharimonadales bacterium]
MNLDTALEQAADGLENGLKHVEDLAAQFETNSQEVLDKVQAAGDKAGHIIETVAEKLPDDSGKV